MPTPRINVKTALRELANLRKSESRLQKKFDKEIEPHEKYYLAAIDPIEKAFEPKFTPIRDRISALEKEVEAQMLSTQTPDGSLKLMRLEEGGLVAEASGTARREVSAKAFFDAVKTKDGTFFDCLKVQIAKAEKLMGSAIDGIATIRRSWKVKITEKV